MKTPRFFVVDKEAKRNVLLSDVVEALEYSVEDGEVIALNITRIDMTDDEFAKLSDISD